MTTTFTIHRPFVYLKDESGKWFGKDPGSALACPLSSEFGPQNDPKNEAPVNVWLKRDAGTLVPYLS